MMTQYSMDPVAKLGLLKMDFLGLTALAILDHTIKLLDETKASRSIFPNCPWTTRKPSSCCPPEKQRRSSSWRAQGSSDTSGNCSHPTWET